MYTVYITLYTVYTEGGDGVNLYINATGDKPMYEQVKDGIRQAIINGELKAHELMPSVRQLAADLNVSMITTKRAYADLEQEGLIYTVAGKGTFVKLEDISMIQEKHVDEALELFRKQAEVLKNLEVPKERLDDEIKTIYKGGK